MTSVEVHIKVQNSDGSADTLDADFVSVGVAHEKVQRFFTDLQLREI